MRAKINEKRRILLGIAFSLVFVYLVLREIDLKKLGAIFSQSNMLMMIPFLGCVSFFFWLKGERWRFILQPLRESTFKEVFPPMMIGVSVNYILFAYVGELFRTYLFHKATKLPKTSIFASIVLERILDVIFVLLLAGIGFSFASPLPDIFVTAGYTISSIALAAITSIICLVFFTDTCLRILRYLLGIIPLHLRKSFIQHVEQGIKGLHSLAHPKLFIRIILISLVQWTFMGLCAYLTMLSVGIHVPLYASFITIAAVAFGIILPSSPAHLGVVEFCFIISLKIFNIPQEQALAAALLYHFFLYTSVIVSGMWFLKKTGVSFTKAKEQAEEFNAIDQG